VYPRSPVSLLLPSLTPYTTSPSPKMGDSYAPTYAIGHISATGDPIGSTVGFSGTADRTALFTVRTNPRWRPPPSWIVSNGHISATATYIYCAHCAVTFAIAQLSCVITHAFVVNVGE